MRDGHDTFDVVVQDMGRTAGTEPSNSRSDPPVLGATANVARLPVAQPKT